MDPDLVRTLKALTDASRLRIVGRLAAGPASTEDLARELDMPRTLVGRHVALLRRAGLIGTEPVPGGMGPRAGRDARVSPTLTLRLERLQTVGRQLAQDERAAQPPAVPLQRADGQPIEGEEAKVLRGYLEDGRLTTIPASSRKRDVVLRWLRDQVFTEDRPYPEKEVNQRLGIFHRDVASLRRYMVDAKLVDREAGLYRRR